MMPEKRLELVHFQLTKNCNLRCWFCGQWGKKGFFADSAGREMTREDWLAVVRSLQSYSRRTGVVPSVILWGGEPLLSPWFDEIALGIHAAGFPLGVVTNGTLLHQHIEVCKTCFDTIYVSVDGPQKLHDSIRGKGVFDRVRSNCEMLQGGKANLVILSVLTEELQRDLKVHLQAVSLLNPNQLILQEMISLSETEVCDYRSWLKSCFGQRAVEIEGWRNDTGVQGKQWNPQELYTLNEMASFPVIYLPHGDFSQRKFCLSAWRHAHIAWNGNVLYCTDFYDFSAGNIHQSCLEDIFNNAASEKFREEVYGGRCSTCRHCSWRNSEQFGLNR